MTATLSEGPCPPVRDLENESWARSVRYKEFCPITFVWQRFCLYDGSKFKREVRIGSDDF
eukprot:1144177-Pelagomonas_calceolata.AAC.2